MKVLKETSDELVMQSRPWWIWLVGGIFAIAGFIPLLTLGTTSLTCQRSNPPPAGNCRLVKTQLLGTKATTIPLSELQGARVDSKRDSDGDRTYRVSLETRQQQIPLTGYSSGFGSWSYQSKQALARRINHFVDNPQEVSLSEFQDDRVFAYLFTAIFLVVGVGLILIFGETLTLQFNRTLGELNLQRRGLLGQKASQHSLRKLRTVEVESSRDSDGDRLYRVSLVWQNGDSPLGRQSHRLPLTRFYSSGRQGKQQTADRIKTFLRLKDEESD